ncbi:hypothetical protein GCM10023212_14780 [Luteolibacter yonseiensis]
MVRHPCLSFGRCIVPEDVLSNLSGEAAESPFQIGQRTAETGVPEVIHGLLRNVDDRHPGVDAFGGDGGWKAAAREVSMELVQVLFLTGDGDDVRAGAGDSLGREKDSRCRRKTESSKFPNQAWA